MPYVPYSDVVGNVSNDASSDDIRDYSTGKFENKIKIFPENLTFPATASNAQSVGLSVLLQNEGFKDMSLDGVIISGDFVLVGTVPSLIRAGEAEGIQIKFAPKRAGVHTGSVYIDGDEIVGKRLLSLSGSGT